MPLLTVVREEDGRGSFYTRLRPPLMLLHHRARFYASCHAALDGNVRSVFGRLPKQRYRLGWPGLEP